MQYKLLAGDIALIAFSIITSSCIILFFDGKSISSPALFKKMNWLWALFFIFYPFSMYISGLYSPNKKNVNFLKLAFTIIFTSLSIAATLFFFPRFIIGRKLLMIHLPLVILLLFFWRVYVARNFKNVSNRIRLGVIGKGDIVSKFIEAIAKDPYSPFLITDSYIVNPTEPICIGNGNKSQINEKTISQSIDIINIDALAIDMSLPISDDEVKIIFKYRFNHGKSIFDLTKLYEINTGKVPVFYINQRWFLNNPFFHRDPDKMFTKIKRLYDLILSFIFIFLFSPVILVTAICVKLESKGPILYTQERLGLNRIPFRCYKFRTMIHHAEIECGPTHSCVNDKRLTRIGKVLRRSRIDELPQLFNIIRGDLSFVGPRPIRQYFADQFSNDVPFYEFRHNIKPGLTGWAQVHGCYAVPYGLESLQYELFYIEHMSMILDFHILFKTIKTIIKIEGK